MNAWAARHDAARDHARRAVLCALALALAGVVVQLAVVEPARSDMGERPFRQAAYLVAAAVLGAGAAALGWRRAVDWSRPLLWVTWALLGVLLLPGMPDQYGAVRWLEVGPIHIQPSELAKLTMILFLTAFAARRRERLGSFVGGFLPAMGYVGVTAALVRFEPDLGQTLFLVALSGAVLVANGLRIRHAVPVFLIAAPLLVVHALGGDAEGPNYVERRLSGFLEGTHFQVEQGLLYFAAGGLDGRGLDAHRAQLFVPKIHNDFVLVAVGEIGGFLASAALLALFAGLFWNGLRLALAAEDRRAASVAFGVSFMIALQAAVNIAVVTDSVPPKGMSLPFLSYGGSSLLVLGIATGLLWSVGRGEPDPIPTPAREPVLPPVLPQGAAS